MYRVLPSDCDGGGGVSYQVSAVVKMLRVFLLMVFRVQRTVEYS